MPTISSLLRRLNKDLTCTICLCTFEQATCLPCQHIFCRGCVDQLLSKVKEEVQTTGRAETAVCPLCKETFSRRSINPASHMQELVKNFRLMVTSYEAEFSVMSQRPVQISEWNEKEEGEDSASSQGVTTDQATVPSQEPSTPNSGGRKRKAEGELNKTPPPVNAQTEEETRSLGDDGSDVYFLESPVLHTPCAFTKRRLLTKNGTFDYDGDGGGGGGGTSSSLYDTIPTQNTLIRDFSDDDRQEEEPIQPLLQFNETRREVPPPPLQVIIPRAGNALSQNTLEIFDSEEERECSVATCPLPSSQQQQQQTQQIPNEVEELITYIFDDDYDASELPSLKKKVEEERGKRKMVIPASSKTQDEVFEAEESPPFTLELATSPIGPIKQKKKIIIAAISSTINPDQRTKIQKFAQNMGDLIVTDISEEVSHFIVTDEDSYNSMKKSLSFLLALIYGCKIVKFSWIEQSWMARKWLPEKEFLIEEEVEEGELPFKNQRKQLFENLGFLLHASCTSSSPQKNRLDLNNLVRLCGGRVIRKDELSTYLALRRQYSTKKLVVRSRWRLEVKVLSVFMGLSTFSIDNLKTEMKRHKGSSILLIDGNWVIESILAGTLMPLAGFVRNLEDVCN